jgi:hypothetical protein
MSDIKIRMIEAVQTANGNIKISVDTSTPVYVYAKGSE